MKTKNENHNELYKLCNLIRTLVSQGSYDLCMNEIRKAMEKYPDSPEPHNLLGIVYEKKGNHAMAMKHFRASWALDDTYLPAKQNLCTYGTFYSFGKSAFDKTDVRPAEESEYETIYDERGVGHFVR